MHFRNSLVVLLMSIRQSQEPSNMSFKFLATELLLHIFRSCASVSDVINLSSSCRRFRHVFNQSNKLQTLTDLVELEFGPLEDLIQIVTQNSSQPAHLIRTATINIALLEQAVKIGRIAQKWEVIYPVKKWKADYEDRRSLTGEECYRLRRALYRLWLYHRAFHIHLYDRFSRDLRHIITERAQLLHNWSTTELAEIEDLRLIICDVVRNHICPSNSAIQRKFCKRYPGNSHQLTFNTHWNAQDQSSTNLNGVFDMRNANNLFFYTSPSSSLVDSSLRYRSNFRNDIFHDPGFEGWGDEIPHYYVVQDMMKLDPGQVLWLREHAPLKEQVEAYVHSLGDWFRDNGETFGDTYEWVMKERGTDLEELRMAVVDRVIGIVCE